MAVILFFRAWPGMRQSDSPSTGGDIPCVLWDMAGGIGG